MRESLELTDPAALRALAHPLRVRLIDLLRQRGPSTASRLAQAVGATSGDTSYHLRQLARHGLIEELPARCRGRERWWQAAARHFHIAAGPEVPAALHAASRLDPIPVGRRRGR